MKIPPILFAPQGSPADQATQDMLAAAQPLGAFLCSLPPSGEREQAVIAMSAAMLWASQAVLRAMPHSRVVIADASELQRQ